MLKKPRSQAPMPVLFAAPVPTLVVYQHARNSQHAFSQRLPKQYRDGAQALRPVSLEVANTYVEHMFHEQGRQRNGADRLLYAATKPLRFEQVCQSIDLLVPSKQGHIGTLEEYKANRTNAVVRAEIRWARAEGSFPVPRAATSSWAKPRLTSRR